MADYIVKDTELTSVANAIRTAGGTSSLLNFPNGFVSAVNNINGGGLSDFSTAQVTVVNNSVGFQWADAIIFPEPYNVLLTDYGKPPSGTTTKPLYKGSLILSSNGLGNVSVSGACEYADDQFTITGDCTITIS